MDNVPLVNWLNKQLSRILECEVGDEYCRNVLQMDKETELIPFIEGLLDMKLPENKRFLNEFLDRLTTPAVETDVTIYRKPDLESDLNASKQRKQKSKKGKQIEDEEVTPKTTTLDAASQKHKKQFINLYSSGGHAISEVKLPGRHPCECQAFKHKLIGNCLKCGRIVCEQEESGPCYFCGNLVCTREEMEKINSGSKKGEKLKSELMSKQWQGFNKIINDLNKITVNPNSTTSSLQRAIEHKNKLIEYDRNSTKRTQVIDDEADYFQSNSKWLTKEQREKLRQKQEEIDEKRYGSRLKPQKYTLDLSNKSVIEDSDKIDYDKMSQEIENIVSNDDPKFFGKNIENLINNRNFPKTSSDIVNPNIIIDAPIFIDEKSNSKKSNKPLKESNQNLKSTQSGLLRIQDKELQELKDNGMCLSMHQPWASLLVSGIKKHEGRTWYTPYRGRLWIHSASKQPTKEEIQSIEEFYRNMYPAQDIRFPSSYPTSCLLGYVNLVECLSEEAYKTQYQNGGESDSPYVFICENPSELVVKVPMSGQHKIFKLDRNIHNGARKTAVICRDGLE